MVVALHQTVRALFICLSVMLTAGAASGETRTLEQALAQAIVGPDLPLAEVQAYTESRVFPAPKFESLPEWQQYASRLREQILDQVIFRGEAAAWRGDKTRVEWLETIPGPSYRIRKLRYEALPGLWIPALLYEPEKVDGKVPVVLNVNGHDRAGKAAPYKQIRCINLAKRGMLALNVEWFGMGQLRAENFAHYRMNQLDLCGASGIALHYLYLKRALDLLLGLEQADPERVAVTGLSGGGYQTILIGALDTRVKLANPVAGYSSYRTRARFLPDLGDSEQTPSDLAALADYTHLTALLAPRPSLLTYNAKDECCFRADYALDPLLDAARPIFRLYDRLGNLRFHVNHDPGTHNYERENREVFYRMLGDFFYSAGRDFKWEEIPSQDELKTEEELRVDLPAQNADFHSLALDLSRHLPRHPGLPQDRATAERWQRHRRIRLRQIVRARGYQVSPEKVAGEDVGEVAVIHWKLLMDRTWTVPAVEMIPRNPRGTVVLVADNGRAGAGKEAAELLAAGKRVFALDPFYFGESRIREKDFLYALLLACAGDRPIGVQASQVVATARWLRDESPNEPVSVLAIGPRSSLFSLIAAALEPEAIAGLTLRDSLGSLKQVIEENRTAQEMPELFCFGLLEEFDVKQLAGLVAPRPVEFLEAGARIRAELKDLKDYYKALNADIDPVR